MEPLSIGGTEPPRGRPSRRDALPALTCVAVGVALSILPHLLSWAEMGRPVWIADNDEILYLSMAAQAYHHHPFRLGDPTRPEGGDSTFPWLVLGPAGVAARLIGAGPGGISILWRLGAGVGMGLGIYAVTRQHLARPWAAAGVTILLLADCGVIGERLLVQPIRVTAQVLLDRPGDLFDGPPRILGQWRLMTPALNLPYLLLSVWLLTRARERPTRPRIALAGLGFGLLFYVYFYYWTASGLALLLALAFDAGHRRVYFHAGWLGGLVGLPSVVANAMLKGSRSDEWLRRTDKFLSIPHTSELIISKSAILLLILGVAWLWLRRRELWYCACLVLAGLLLTNHQLVTGLQIENFHWMYVAAVLLPWMLLVLAWREVERRPSRVGAAGWLLAALCVAEVADGLWLRSIEGARSRDARANMADYRDYASQRLRPDARRLRPGATIGGDRRFVNMAIIFEDVRPLDSYGVQFSPSVDNAEWDARIALNAFLLGEDGTTFRAEQERLLGENVWGAWARDEGSRERRLAGLVGAFDRVAADPGSAIDRFGVRYVAFRAGQAPPAYLSAGWRPFDRGPHWQVWERIP